MEFEVHHTFPVSPETLWDTLYDPAYEQANAERSGLPRTLVSDKEHDGVRTRHIQVRGRRELPAVMARVLGANSLDYELVETSTRAELTMRWRVIPSMMPDKIRAEGSYQIVAVEGGCERRVRGVVKVSVPLLGGRIERAIGDELRTSYEDNAEFVRGWLTKNA